MFENVLLILAYTGVGLGILVVGFYVLDLLTPGKLGEQVMEGNPGAALVSATSLVSLGVVMWFAIFFTGAGWEHLDDAGGLRRGRRARAGGGDLHPRPADPGQAHAALLRADAAPRRVGDERRAGGDGARRRREPDLKGSGTFTKGA